MLRFRSMLIWAAALALPAGCGGHGGIALPAIVSDPSTVLTDKGYVHGSTSGNVRTFLGIPYAAPPTGANRFMPPQPATAWTTQFDATKPGNVCPQPPNPFGQTQETTEDCLNLNVTAPVAGANLPVMVWIHGGAYIQGAGVYYPPAALVSAGNIVVVTINYRLGIFGWLTNAALAQSNGSVGDYGLQDQEAALAWVQRNIAGFGGNPAGVTIAGESAGALSVCNLIASPGAQGYVRAIAESGACSFNNATTVQAETVGTSIATALGCTGTSAAVAACLRSPNLGTPQGIAQVMSVQSQPAYGLAFGPVTGGPDVPQQPRASIGKVPMLQGGNKLEMGLFVTLGIPVHAPASQAEYNGDVTALYGGAAPAVLAQYPYTNYPNGYTAISTVLTDYNVVVAPITFCDDVTTFTLQAATATPLYAYEFSEPNAPALALNLGLTTPSGPQHAAELVYLWPGLSPSYPPTSPPLPAAQAPLSAAMIAYWTNFVRSGNPNGAGLPNWPAYHTPTDALQLTTASPGIASGADVSAEHKCPFWNSLGLATGFLRAPFGTRM
jgi:para-nitrobenzyl esterase